MGFRNEAYATVWGYTEKGKYGICELSTSRKDKASGEYSTDFSSKFVRFIGTAHDKANGAIDRQTRIQLKNVEVTTSKSNNTWYTNFLVFDFDYSDSNNGNGNANGNAGDLNATVNTDFISIPDSIMEELPFN